MFQDRIAHDLAIVKVKIAYEQSEQQRQERKTMISPPFDAVKVYHESYKKYLDELEENDIGKTIG